MKSLALRISKDDASRVRFLNFLYEIFYIVKVIKTAYICLSFYVFMILTQTSPLVSSIILEGFISIHHHPI